MSAQILAVAILNDLVRAPVGELDAVIETSLDRLCRHVQASRASIFQRRTGDLFASTHGSDATAEPTDDAVQAASFALTASWRAELDAGQPVHVPDIANLPDCEPAKAMLQSRGVRSLVIAPMQEAGQLAGFICFEALHEGRVFDDEQMALLKASADVIQTLLIRRTTEVRLVDTAHRLEATLAALPDLLFEIDADGCYTGYTAGPAHLMAAPPETLAGMPIDVVLPPDVAAIAKAALRVVVAKGSVSGIRYRLKVPDGEHLFELSGALKPGSGPNEPPTAIFLVRDVTRDEQMRDELLRLGKIVEAMNNLVAIIDPEQRVVWVNPAFEEQTGWRLDEIRGKDLGDLLRCPESDPETIAQVGEAITHRRAFRGEMINKDRHGNRYWVDFNVLPLFDTNGGLQGYVSVETVVTKLKEQEVALARLAQTAAAAHTRLENAIMSLPDGVVIFDSDFRLTVANRAYRETFPDLAESVVPGVHLKDLLRQGLDRGIFLKNASAKDKEKWLASRLKHYQAPQHTDEVELPDGRFLRRINTRTSDGGCIAVGIDITAQRRHVAALDAVNLDLIQALDERNKTEKRLVGIIEGADVGTWEWDIPGDGLHIGGHWAEMLGYDKDALKVQSVRDFRHLLHPDDLKSLDASRNADLSRGEDIIELEFRMRHRDGHWVWILSRSRVTERALDGTPLFMAGVHLDISERKRLEQEIGASRAYLSQVMDTSIAAIAVMDSTGALVYANREAENILGLTRSEILGRKHNDPAWRVERVSGGPLPDEELPFLQALAKEGPVRDIQFALHWPDGTRRVLSCNATPLSFGDQKIQVVASFSDITERLAATERLEEALVRAEEMSRAKSIFLANMSHEIRTPLNGVLGMAEVLESTLTAPDQKRMIGTIRNSGETLLAVLNSILDMSKIEAGKMELEQVPLVMSDLIAQVEALYAVQAEEKGLEFEILSSAGADRARLGDPHRIQQILNNLMNNAIKFTERGSVTLKLSCRVGKPVTIEISDTGVGMTESQIERAFESFEQADGSMTRRFGGTGLGLSIVRQLVMLMGGEIALESEAGRGTKVRVTLPLPETDISDAPQTTAPNDTPTDVSFKGLQVLCADDNPINRMVLSEMLAHTGITLTQVENGQQAVDAWAAASAGGNMFDLLLLDITMPVRDGMSALAEIRASETAEGRSPVPAIAVTANAMPYQVAEYIVGGFDTHLAKPFKQKDLLHALQTLLRA